MSRPQGANDLRPDGRARLPGSLRFAILGGSGRASGDRSELRCAHRAPGHGTPDPDFQIVGGWESVRSVVDVGGGTGAMLAQILLKWREIRGTLVDLPRTVALSRETFQTAGVSERVTTVGQSFFEPLPSGADLYLLKGILNDWPDAQATAILRRCGEAARPGGRVVVLGGVAPDGARRSLVIEMVLLGGNTLFR